MTRSICKRLPAVAALVAVVVASGCAGTQPTRFYTLSKAMPSAGNERIPLDTPSVGVGPVSLPRYLDRPQVVTRSGANTLLLAEFDAWAEPLEDMVPRMMAENLSAELGADRVYLMPRRTGGDVNRQVVVDVVRFDADVGGDVVLVSRWQVLDGISGRLLRDNRSTIRQTPAGQGYDAIAAAMSDALATLSKEIAGAIRSLPVGS